VAEPDICVFMPVYRGADVVAETVRAIREQTYVGFRVLVSVDGHDAASLDACRAAVAGDARFAFVLQPEPLGWPGNFNWLVERCDLPFLIYWQQDDLASTGYLAALRSALLADETAAVAYTDVQWFGAKTDRDELPSIAGPPLARVLEQLEGLSYVPLRGLIRTAMLPPAPAISPSRDRSAQQEFLFLARLASAGGFVRVDDGLYFKRAHADAETNRMYDQPEHRRRRESARLGAGVLALLREHAPAGTDGVLLAVVLDRLGVFRPGRRFFAEPDGTPAGVRDLALLLADEAGIDLGDARWALDRETGMERAIHPWVRDVLAAERTRAAQLRWPAPPLAAHLGWGWHEPEPWGAWTQGEHASVELGDWCGGTVRFEGRAFAPRGPVRIGWSLDGDHAVHSSFSADDAVVLEADVPAGAPRLQLHLPDAVSPVEAHLSGDPRRLSFGLERVVIG
jgi:glycosyltransferase involved in cell wall biosynthesis